MPTVNALNTRHWYMFGKPVERQYTDKQLRALAVDALNNNVFTSDQIPEHSLNLTRNVFMPVLFGALEDAREQGITMLYEDMSEAGPRAVNGLPMFMSCKCMNFVDHSRFHELVREMAFNLEDIIDPA